MDFDQLYKEQFPVVYRYLTGLCGNQALAEELTQETFCRAIEHSASFSRKMPAVRMAVPNWEELLALLLEKGKTAGRR